MKILSRPHNRWGWARIGALGLLALAALWTLLAAALRSFGEIPWLAWSGYQAFTPLDGVELAALLLLGALAAAWLEEQDHAAALEHSRRQEAERAAAAHQEKAIGQFRDTIHVQTHQSARGGADLEAGTGEKIREAVQAVLPELNGKGRGEILLFLYEEGLLRGETPPLSLSGLDFRETDLRHTHLRSHAHLDGISLEGADLRKARLDHARLANSRFNGANLRRAFLRHADLRGARLAGCDLSAARLDGASLEGADLTGVVLEGAILSHASLKGCALDGTLDQAVLIDTITVDGAKVTNEKGREYLRRKEIAVLIDRL